MKKLKIVGFGILFAFLTSCVSSKKFLMVEMERSILEERVKELEEEVASKENLIFFLESEIKYVQSENKDEKN
jgi:hypothetical protein